MVGRLVDCWIGWLVGELTDRLVEWLFDWLVIWLIDWFIGLMTGSDGLLVDWLAEICWARLPRDGKSIPPFGFWGGWCCPVMGRGVWI